MMKKPYSPPKIVSSGQICRKGDFVCIDDIKIGKYVERDGIAYLQIADKDPHRSAKRGTRLVEIPFSDLGCIKFES